MPAVKDRINVVLTSIILKVVYLTALFASSNIWDTSSQLLFDRSDDSESVFTSLARRLIAWDVVFFNAIADVGTLYEHEHAFSVVWANIIGSISYFDTITSRVLTGFVVSFLAHLVACLLIYEIANIKPLRDVNPRSAALIYSASPAGIFLICGYAESLCATLTFFALLCFLKYRKYVLSGLIFALAVQLRPNTLIWGNTFIGALAGELLRTRWRWKNIQAILAGGLELGTSFAYSQYEAYAKYCPGQVWCDLRPPSIYTYIQSKYWNVGFLRYWKFANIPNFLLALPTLILLYHSSQFLWHRKLAGVAMAQFLTLFGALFFWNVQIVTRIASSLPGPSLYLADLLQRSPKRARWWIGSLLVWAIVQSTLYGAFLPPA